MNKIMKTLDTKMLIVHLLKEVKKTYLSVYRLRKLMLYMYSELSRKKQVCNYDICFDIDSDSIERTVLYNNHIFELDTDGEIIYLRNPERIEALAEQYKTDDIITSIIGEFINTIVA